MAIEILLPRLGWTMEEGTFVEWLKHDGETITPGDVLFTVESDKSLNEVEAFDAGILRIPPDSPAPGSRVPVGTVLGYLDFRLPDLGWRERHANLARLYEELMQRPSFAETVPQE